MKILSIIGIVFASIFILWTFFAVLSSGAISLVEGSPLMLIFALFNLALAIVALKNSNKK